MKKLLALLPAFLMLFMVSCSDSDDPAPAPPSPTPDKTYLQILREDVNTILTKYPAWKKESDKDYPFGYFREADYVLNGFVSDLPVSEIKAVSVVYGFDYTTLLPEEQQHILQATRDFTKGLDADMTYQTYDGTGYPLNVAIIQNLDKIISLEHAIKNLKESNVVIPRTTKVSLCYPSVPHFDRAIIYRFGLSTPQDDVQVWVNAETGEVKTTPTH